MAESWTNFPGQFGPITVVLKRQAYLNNKRLAVEVVAKQDGAEVSYAIVTKNFSDEVVSGPDCGFFDVNNYGYIFKWMLEEGKMCIRDSKITVVHDHLVDALHQRLPGIADDRDLEAGIVLQIFLAGGSG